MRAGILVTVRLKSARLPRKALLPLGSGTLLSSLVDRLAETPGHPPVVLCTSTLPEDDEIEAVAAEKKVACYRGDPVDVLERLRGAAEAFAFERVWNVTGDNPFVDPPGLSAMMQAHMSQGNDFTKTEGLPLGAFGYALETKAMQIACERKAGADTEIWGPLFTDTGLFRCGVYREPDPARRFETLRLTVDTPEDYQLAQELVRRFPRWPTLAEIIDVCRKDPNLTAINSQIPQRVASPEVARLKSA